VSCEFGEAGWVADIRKRVFNHLIDADTRIFESSGRMEYSHDLPAGYHGAGNTVIGPPQVDCAAETR